LRKDAVLLVEAAEKYVSRGGHKLEAALHKFQISCHGLVAPTSARPRAVSTDCLLQREAARVYAVDVGKGQLDWKLRQDVRVVVHDETNARHLTGAALGEPVDLVTIDVSFISLTRCYPRLSAPSRSGARL